MSRMSRMSRITSVKEYLLLMICRMNNQLLTVSIVGGVISAAAIIGIPLFFLGRSTAEESPVRSFHLREPDGRISRWRDLPEHSNWLYSKHHIKEREPRTRPFTEAEFRADRQPLYGDPVEFNLMQRQRGTFGSVLRKTRNGKLWLEGLNGMPVKNGARTRKNRRARK